MKDRSWYWSRGRTAYQLWTRVNLPSLWSLFAAVAFCFKYGNDWSIKKWDRGGPVSASIRTMTHFQHRCYCPEGSTSEFRASFFNAFVWVQLSRSRVETPCWCDVVIWKLYPDDHARDVEEAGGWDAIIARHPAVADVKAA